MATLIVTSALSSPAFAQQVAAGQAVSAGNGEEVGQIIVTARRREEAIQDVPVAISVATAEDLERATINDLTDLRRVAPALISAPGTGRPSSPALSIRSLRDNTASISQDPPVAMYFAEAVANRPQGFGRALYDLESVQVLKGPQGTLFGRSATGGAVLISPRRPTNRYEGRLEMGYGNFDRFSASGTVNIPLGETFAVRAAGSFVKRDGFARNIATGQSLGEIDSLSGRVGMLWTPTGNFKSYLVVDLFRANDTPQPFQLLQVNPNSPVAQSNGLPAQLLATRARSHDVGTLNEIIESRSRNTGVTNVSELTLGGVTFKNILGYRKAKTFDVQEVDATAVPLLAIRNDVMSEQLSEEFQILGSTFGDRLDYVVGLNYFNENNFQRVDQNLGTPNLLRILTATDNSSKAVYGSGTYKVTDAVNLTAGLRWTRDERAQETTAFRPTAGDACLLTIPGAAPPPTCRLAADTAFERVTYTLTADYKPSDNVMVYLTHRRGYRSGGFNSIGTSLPQFTPYKPEIVEDVEAGLKSTFRLGSMPTTLNLAVYSANYTDIQRQVTASIGGVTTATVLNAGPPASPGANWICRSGRRPIWSCRGTCRCRGRATRPSPVSWAASRRTCRATGSG